MMRLLRPLGWLCVSIVALGGFAWLGSMSPHRLRVSDPSGWLSVVSPQDALVELARCVGLVLAGYVALVALLAVLGEIAWTVRVFSLAHLLRSVSGAIAVPALRRRIAGASMSAILTVSAGAASLGGRALASAPAAQTSNAPSQLGARSPANLLPAGVSASDLVGFGLDDTAAAPAQTNAVRVTARKGDTIWALAVAQYGECTPQIADIVAAASGVTDPALIFVGQTLVFPALDPPARTTPTTPPESGVDPSAHAVVHGDTLWSITKHRYGRVDAPLMGAVAVFNGIADPNDIPIGFVLLLPDEDVLYGTASQSDGAAPVGPQASTPAAVVVIDTPTPPPSNTPAIAPTPPAPVPVGSDPVGPLEVGNQSKPTDPVAVTPLTPAGAHVDAADGPSVPWRIGLAGSSTLAAALLGAYVALRRRQRAAGARCWRMLSRSTSMDTYRRLVAAADLPLGRWAAQELAGLLSSIGPLPARPVAVEISQLAGIELLWDAPIKTAPTPWEPTPGGWSWRLLYDPIAEVPAETLPAAVPGLVTVGARHDAQVLVDLEAFGSISIDGDEHAAEDLIRSIVLELGAGEDLSDARVFTLGLDVDGVEHLARVQQRPESETLAHARSIVADVQRVLTDDGLTDTFGLTTTHAAGREVTVIAARASSCTIAGELLALATPRCGLVVIMLGATDDAGLDLVIDSSGSVQLAALGMTLEAARVSRQASAGIAVLLDEAAAPMESVDGPHPPVETIDTAAEDPEARCDGTHVERPADDLASMCAEGDIDLDAAGALLDANAAADDDEWARPNPRLLVRVLGKPTVDNVADLGRFEQMVLVYVVAAGGEADKGSLIDAVWSGARVSDKRLQNVLGNVRARIGADICPARSGGSPKVRIVGAMTDLDVFEALVARAAVVSSGEALELLTEALDLITGEPFDDVGCEWAFDSQLTYRAAQAIETAALRAVDLALTADDPVVARTAISRALRAMPGNEVLYRARMRVEAHLDSSAGVRSVYAELRAVLADLGSLSGDKGDPSPATRRLYEQLIGLGGSE